MSSFTQDDEKATSMDGKDQATITVDADRLIALLEVVRAWKATQHKDVPRVRLRIMRVWSEASGKASARSLSMEAGGEPDVHGLLMGIE